MTELAIEISRCLGLDYAVNFYQKKNLDNSVDITVSLAWKDSENTLKLPTIFQSQISAVEIVNHGVDACLVDRLSRLRYKMGMARKL